MNHPDQDDDEDGYRDYLAALAMQALVSPGVYKGALRAVAITAYDIADTMLAVRKERAKQRAKK